MRFFTSYSSPVYLDSFSKDLFIKISFLIVIISNIALWLLFFFYTEDLTVLSPLHYTIYFGIDSLRPWYYIFMMPASGLFIGFFNLILSFVLYRKDKLLSYFLAISAAAVSCFLLLAGIFIIFVLYN